MKVSTEKTDNQQVNLTIEVNDEDMESHIEIACNKMSKKMNFPGFRKGKVPRSVLENSLGKQRLIQESLDTLIPDVVFKAVDKEKLEIVSTPVVSVESLDPKLEILAKVALIPIVNLSSYEKFKITQSKNKVGVKEINNVINQVRESQLTWIPVERTVKRGDSLIIDFSSTKKEICDAISDHPKRDQFLATHPIAGTEFSGPDSAFENLFHNKIQILCETNKTRKSLLEFATKWFLKIRMKIREISPIEHALQVAYVSHLSHISSFMLGKTVIEKSKNETTILNLAGSGFESTVRLAKSSPDMWVPIFKQNRSNVIETLSQYIDNLNKFKNLVDECKYEEIYDQMKSINSIRKILDGLTNSGKT